MPKSHDAARLIDQRLGAKTAAAGVEEKYQAKHVRAQPWQGWGTALKPSVEPIVLARVPLDGNIAGNLLKHRTGALNIDACMAGDRWPANMLHDGSPEVMATMPTSGGIDGSVARYFYCAKADTAERVGSDHPTVKPLALMRWLVRLVCARGGLVLDPFAGTGTTGAACLMEGIRCIMIEREPDYQAAIEKRLAMMSGSDEGLFAQLSE